MEHKIEVIHISMEINADFDTFTQVFEGLLGKFDRNILKEVDFHKMEKLFKEMAGEEDLMLFQVLDHGGYLNIMEFSKKAKQYVLGDHLTAIKMTRRDIRAGLYAPLRVLIYEADNHSTRVEFDQPSSLFGQFRDPDVTATAKDFDTRLSNFIQKAELRASSQNNNA